MEKIEKGDLVKIKGTENLGIVVDILRRSSQNDDWSQVLVYADGWCDAFSPRRLIPQKNGKNLCRNVKD